MTAQYRKSKEHFDAPGFELYDHLLSICNQSCDVNSEPAELRLICEKLQFVSVEDIKQESLALHKMVVDGGSCLEKSIQEMSIVLNKIEDFVSKESANVVLVSSGDLPAHNDELWVKVCSHLPVMPEEFRCPISLELMKDPVIISTGQVCT